MNGTNTHEAVWQYGGATNIFSTFFRTRHGKAFLLTGLDSEDLRFNVKCDPEKAIELREDFACVLPGYHMNKKHWNTIVVDGSVSSKQLKEWIDHSYNLVIGKKKPK